MRPLLLLLKRLRQEPAPIGTGRAGSQNLPEARPSPGRGCHSFFADRCNCTSYRDQREKDHPSSSCCKRTACSLLSHFTIRKTYSERENRMTKLERKAAVITVGSSGIGLATAKRFVAEGASVYITGRRKPELDAAVQQIGNHITGVQGDVSNLADLDRLYATVQQQHDHIDVVFANPGLGNLAPLGKISRANFDKEFA